MGSEQRIVRVAIDTNVLLSGVIWPRWPYAVLQHARRGDFQLVIPEIVLLEARRNIQNRFVAHLGDFEFFLLTIDFELVPLPSDEEVRSASRLMRQVEDIPVALSVIAAKVDYFITLDRDFTDSSPTTRQIQDVMPNIMLPAQFLRKVMNWSSEQLEAIRHRSWSDFANETTE
jgi:predicted nucleic acid-binding protein